jgi:GTPase Era involved in 16S rRNA processing
MVTKISLVGKPEVGKTTIKKVIFEGEDPNELALFPLEATIGIKYSVHQFMDLKISLLDTPGQSLPVLLKDEEKQITSFENSSAIIYVFDYPTWITDSQDIIDDIQSLYNMNKKHGFNAKLILFLHKIDLLIDKRIGRRLDLIRRQIKRQLELPEELAVYFTSLHPNLIYTIYYAISDTFSNFSLDTSKLKEMLTKSFSNLNKAICFVTNQDDNLIVQVSSKDFDSSSLYYLYDRIYKESKSPEESFSKAKFISAGPKILYKSKSEIGRYHTNFKDLFIFSEVIKEEDLDKLKDEIINQLDLYYK